MSLEADLMQAVKKKFVLYALLTYFLASAVFQSRATTYVPIGLGVVFHTVSGSVQFSSTAYATYGGYDSGGWRFYNVSMDGEENSSFWINSTGAVTVMHLLYGKTVTLSIVGAAGTDTTTQLSLYGYGEPQSITGQTSYSYSSTTKILSIVCHHSSTATVTISYVGEVDVGGPYGYTWNPFDLFSQYLRMGNLVGFITATYTVIMGEAWYGFVILIFAIPIYFRTESLFYVCMVFLLGGGFFVYLLPPAAWHIAVVFMVLGVAGLLYKVFTRERD